MLQPPIVSSCDEQLAGKVGERLGRRALAGGGRLAGVGGFAQAHRQRQAAEEGDSQPLGLGLGAAMAERVRQLAAMRAFVAGHVLDHPGDRHLHLLEQIDRPRRVDQRQVLRRRDDDRAGRPRLLDQGQLHVAGARRQVDQDQLGIAPIGLDQLVQARPSAIGPRQASACPRRTNCPSDRSFTPCASIGISRSPSAVGCCVAQQRRLRRAHRCRHRPARPSCPIGPRRWRGWPPASTCRPRPCRCRSRSASGRGLAAVSATRASVTPGMASAASRRLALERVCRHRRGRSRRRPAVATPPASRRERMRAASGWASSAIEVGHGRAT